MQLVQSKALDVHSAAVVLGVPFGHTQTISSQAVPSLLRWYPAAQSAHIAALSVKHNALLCAVPCAHVHSFAEHADAFALAGW